MKKLIVLNVVLFTMLFTDKTFAQKQRTQTVSIRTSAECAICKKKIETLLYNENGVKKANADLETKTVTVTFDSRKISEDNIRMIISNAGYDADSIPANNKALQRVKEIHK